jgi:hypothetical protein
MYLYEILAGVNNMTKRKPNPQRGGRPRSGNVRHTVSLPPALWAHVEAQAGDTRSARLAAVVGRDAAIPLEAIGKLADIVAEEWGESCSADAVYEWLDNLQAKGAR